ncbi:MAG: hypothetical protein ACOX2O_09265 [Bdellovibrionota bacterium]|jgi:hypothetical protein
MIKKKYVILCLVLLVVSLLVTRALSGKTTLSNLSRTTFRKIVQKKEKQGEITPASTEESAINKAHDLSKKNQVTPETVEEAELEKDSKLVKSETIRTAKQLLHSDNGVSASDQKLLAVKDSLDAARSELALEDSMPPSSVPTSLPSPSVEDGVSDPILNEEDLNELRESGAIIEDSDYGLIPGIMSKKTPSNTTTKISIVEPTKPEPTPTPKDEAAPLYTGQARGYAMLYLMQPNARRTVAAELQTLLDSGIREIFLGVLADGTFGKDFEYLKRVLQIFSERGRIITLALYLSNGSTMRKHDRTTIDAGFNMVSPRDFRSLIRYDSETRNKFAEMVKEVKPVFDFNTSLNARNKNIAIVMLEDNLDVVSYLAMRSIAETHLDKNVQFVRNPCPNCYAGNDAEGAGDPIELHHSDDIGALSKGDGLTLDGQSYYFPWENGAGLSVDDVKLLQKTAYSRGLNYFALWRFQRQGIYAQGIPIHPNDRNYEIPTTDQIEIEKEILRDGLNEIMD